MKNYTFYVWDWRIGKRKAIAVICLENGRGGSARQYAQSNGYKTNQEIRWLREELGL